MFVWFSHFMIKLHFSVAQCNHQTPCASTAFNGFPIVIKQFAYSRHLHHSQQAEGEVKVMTRSQVHNSYEEANVQI